ncbi:hypothetical protein DSC45_05705 [Streptomyces sp. YIM 130001]|uniref:hypothetical protein n=1 Tax=Streptomyces sp. YIM 130001 TaxID=2259644 RepID=UPI000E64BD2D|nr:hypothetical protein [Streptomyces sp. YIM 130001]RII19489.1 hypothetical protein DSC45_05705 [Streptomyces sp. YIM 130001]
MNHNTPLSSDTSLPHRSPNEPPVTGCRVLTTAQLRAQGVRPSDALAACRAPGPWQQLLPGVFLLRPGPPTSDERLHAVLLYAGRPPVTRVPRQGGTTSEEPASPYGDALLTGLAALALHGFTSAPPLLALDRLDVLVPRTRRLRSAAFAGLVRSNTLPAPQWITGLPVAPVARALADAVADLDDAESVRRLLTEAVRSGRCDPTTLVAELTRARLLNRPQVSGAVDALRAEGRLIAEERLYRMVREYGLPDPLWNVDLRLPGGPHLGGVDAYWPEQAVALELDTGSAGRWPDGFDESDDWCEHARRREHLERLGITVVHIPQRRLRESMAEQATVVRTALMASDEREPAAYVMVLPR